MKGATEMRDACPEDRPLQLLRTLCTGVCLVKGSCGGTGMFQCADVGWGPSLEIQGRACRAVQNEALDPQPLGRGGRASCLPWELALSSVSFGQRLLQNSLSTEQVRCVPRKRLRVFRHNRGFECTKRGHLSTRVGSEVIRPMGHEGMEAAATRGDRKSQVGVGCKELVFPQMGRDRK